MGFRQDFEDFLENNPAFTSYPFPMGIIGTFILACFPICLFFIFPHIEAKPLKIFLHGLLNPVTLGISYMGNIMILEKIKGKAKSALSILIFLPCLAILGAALHLHLPLHMPESFLDKFLVLFSSSVFGLLLSFLWMYLSKDLRQKNEKDGS